MGRISKTFGRERTSQGINNIKRSMKVITQKLTRKRDCKHSVVFEPLKQSDPNAVEVVTGVYIMKAALATNPGVQLIELQVRVPDQGENLPI